VAAFVLDRPPQERHVDGRLVIDYWEKWTSFEGQAMQDAVDAFNRTDPPRAARQDRAPLHVRLLAQSGVNQKFKLAAAAGIPPDIAGVWSADICTLAEMGAIRPLDAVLQEAGITRDTYLRAFWTPSVYDGRVWAIPTTPATIALHWNRRMFREQAGELRAAGLDPDRAPRTIDELNRYANILTKKNANGRITQLGFTPLEPGWWSWAWGLWWGGKLWDGKSRITIASDENVAAYRWVQSFSRKYGHSAVQAFQSGFGNFNSPQNAFIHEKVAMVLQGVWMYNFINNHNPKLEWGVAPFPSAVAGLENVTIAEYDCLVLPTDGQHPDEAFAFLKFLARPEGMEILCMGQRKFSPLREVTETFRREHPHPYLDVFLRLAHSPNTHHPPQLGFWRAYSREMRDLVQRIWQNPHEDVRAALQDVQRKMQKLLDRELAERAARRRGLEEAAGR
jgi:multiple sugar transport system substrate-binding protein